MSARKKPRTRRNLAPPPLRTIDAIDQYAARAKQSGAIYDAAILQFLREQLWELLTDSGDADQAAKLLAPILAARRQQLAETKAKPASPENDAKSRDEILEQILDPELRGPVEERP